MARVVEELAALERVRAGPLVAAPLRRLRRLLRGVVPTGSVALGRDERSVWDTLVRSGDALHIFGETSYFRF